MNRWAGLGAWMLVVGLASTSSGQFGGMGGGMGGGGDMMLDFGTAGAESPKSMQSREVKLIFNDDKTTAGTLRLTTVVVNGSMGVYEIKPEKVREIRFGGEQEPTGSVMMNQMGSFRGGRIVTTSGENITGVILVPRWWRVETELGVLSPNPAGLKAISFASRGAINASEDDPTIPPPDVSPPRQPGRSPTPRPTPAPGTVPPPDNAPRDPDDSLPPRASPPRLIPNAAEPSLIRSLDEPPPSGR